MQYTINDTNKINNKIISDDIFQEEKVEYRIENRENLIDTLFGWVSESKENDRDLIKEDIKYLITIEDKYVLSSMSTNEYLTEDSEEGQKILEEIYNK